MNYENQSNFLTAHRFDNSKIKKNKEKNKQREQRKKKNPAEPQCNQRVWLSEIIHLVRTQNFPRIRKQLTLHFYETIEKKVVKHKSYRVYEHGRIFWVTMT